MKRRYGTSVWSTNPIAPRWVNKNKKGKNDNRAEPELDEFARPEGLDIGKLADTGIECIDAKEYPAARECFGRIKAKWEEASDGKKRQ